MRPPPSKTFAQSVGESRSPQDTLAHPSGKNENDQTNLDYNKYPIINVLRLCLPALTKGHARISPSLRDPDPTKTIAVNQSMPAVVGHFAAAITACTQLGPPAPKVRNNQTNPPNPKKPKDQPGSTKPPNAPSNPQNALSKPSWSPSNPLPRPHFSTPYTTSCGDPVENTVWCVPATLLLSETRLVW